ncbi:MAG: TAXI family TRAP transporter solute-binding subunit [Pseudomonadota bacterium]
MITAQQSRGARAARLSGSPRSAPKPWGPVALAAALAAACLSAGAAAAQSYGQFVREANTNTVTIVAGAPGETSLEIAHDLSTVLHCVDGLRIVPMAGRGDRNNVYDLLFLRGVDMAIVRADVLDHLEQTGEFTGDLKNRVVYVAPLFEQEVHLIAPNDIQSIEDLEGKIVNIGSPGSLGLAARRILTAAGVTVIETKLDNALALERVIDGGIDAMFITGGKPIPLLSQLDRVNGLRLVPLAKPGDAIYDVGGFTQDDYPSLVPPGRTVETVVVPSVLAVYNWGQENERFDKNALFTRALFKRANYLRRPARHPKWADAPLIGEIAGWRQFAPAESIVAPLRDAAAETIAAAPEAEPLPPENQLEAMFERQLQEFGIQPRTAEERALLFAAFKRRVEASIR